MDNTSDAGIYRYGKRRADSLNVECSPLLHYVRASPSTLSTTPVI